MPKLTTRAARAYVIDVAARVLRNAPEHVRRRGGGLTNLVYQVDVDNRSLIVRVNADPHKLKVFERERQAMKLARAAQLPVPRVVHVGANPYPFMVLENVRGVVGTHAYDKIGTVRQMGEITARIHRIQMPGFGPAAVDRTFAAEAPRRNSWGAHLEADLKASERITTLERLEMLLPDNASKMRQILAHMSTWRRNPVLHHGDMRLKNIIVDAYGKVIAVLDWEHCTSSVPALWDLSVALHDVTIDEKQAFLQGYGYAPRELAKSIGYLRLLNALNYTPFLVAMEKRGDSAKLKWHRARFAGNFNLYQ
ncbi:MAG TPA: aminoglycoside phosphotransferase family protein [Burkholderiaceae bacterium]|nr:aminoglycoside phosphotransferase family protein [Burkholderiaceae bacterium]